jgi:hypothetical protein
MYLFDIRKQNNILNSNVAFNDPSIPSSPLGKDHKIILTFAIYLLINFFILNLSDFYTFDCALEFVLQLSLLGLTLKN